MKNTILTILIVLLFIMLVYIILVIFNPRVLNPENRVGLNEIPTFNYEDATKVGSGLKIN